MVQHPLLRVVCYALEDSFPEQGLVGVDCLVHLAASIADETGNNGEKDIDAAAALIRAAERSGTRVLFVSSQSADLDFPTEYGRTKAKIETMVLARGGVYIRPGLVYGGKQRGTYGQICRLLRSNRVVPYPLPSRISQPIHVDDLCDALWRANDSTTPSRIYRIGDDNGVDFEGFLGLVAWLTLSRHVALVPFPLSLLIWTASIAKWLPFLPRISMDRLIGLRALRKMSTHEDMAALGIRPRPLAAGLAREWKGRRRAVIAEGMSLLSYVLGRPACVGTVKRYVQAVETVHGGVPLLLPRVLLSYNFLWRLADPSGLASRSVLARRLGFAVKIVEASPRDAGMFLNQKDVSAASALIRVVGIGGLELLLRLNS